MLNKPDLNTADWDSIRIYYSKRSLIETVAITLLLATVFTVSTAMTHGIGNPVKTMGFVWIFLQAWLPIGAAAYLLWHFTLEDRMRWVQIRWAGRTGEFKNRPYETTDAWTTSFKGGIDDRFN